MKNHRWQEREPLPLQLAQQDAEWCSKSSWWEKKQWVARATEGSNMCKQLQNILVYNNTKVEWRKPKPLSKMYFLLLSFFFFKSKLICLWLQFHYSPDHVSWMYTSALQLTEEGFGRDLKHSNAERDRELQVKALTTWKTFQKYFTFQGYIQSWGMHFWSVRSSVCSMVFLDVLNSV